MRELDAAGTASVVAIQRLQAAYGDAVTRRAWAEVRALFEPDAVGPHRHPHPRALHARRPRRGRRVHRAQPRVASPSSSSPSSTRPSTSPTADAATGRVYICELRHDTAGEWTQAYGLYRDDYVRRDGDWRIAGRRYRSLARTGPRIESFGIPPTDD